MISAVLVDYGGVLTSPLAQCQAAWCRTERIDPSSLDQVLGEWVGDAQGPAAALERGELALTDFEQMLAARLRTHDGGHPPAQGLTTRMFAALRSDDAICHAMRRWRAAGVATAVVSNSWGLNYPRATWDRLFDAIILSAEIGIRKPDPGIYLAAADSLGKSPEQCVFVDDRLSNVVGASQVGMAGIVHRATPDTIRRIECLLRTHLR